MEYKMSEDLVKREPEINNVNTSAVYPFIDNDDAAPTSTLNDSTQKDDCEILGAFVSREIRQITPGITRRKLEVDIQELILKEKKESLNK